MVNDKNGEAFALIQDTWQFWKTFGDCSIKTERDWKTVMERSMAIIKKYESTPYHAVARGFILTLFGWLEEKSRAEMKEVPR